MMCTIDSFGLLGVRTWIKQIGCLYIFLMVYHLTAAVHPAVSTPHLHPPAQCESRLRLTKMRKYTHHIIRPIAVPSLSDLHGRLAAMTTIPVGGVAKSPCACP